MDGPLEIARAAFLRVGAKAAAVGRALSPPRAPETASWLARKAAQDAEARARAQHLTGHLSELERDMGIAHGPGVSQVAVFWDGPQRLPWLPSAYEADDEAALARFGLPPDWQVPRPPFAPPVPTLEQHFNPDGDQ